MRVGTIADKGVDPVDHAVGDIGVEVETGDDRHAGADDIADGLEEDALGVVLLRRQRRAMRADIDAVERQGRLEPACDGVEQLREEPMLDGPVGPAHRQRDADRLPRPGRIHRRDKAGGLREHRRGRRARLRYEVVALEIGVGEEMRLRRRRREFVALDREAEDGDARGGGSGHGCHKWLSLRAKRRNLAPAALCPRDCFVAALLAMTALS